MRLLIFEKSDRRTNYLSNDHMHLDWDILDVRAYILVEQVTEKFKWTR